MTKKQLFKKYSIDKSHAEWDNQIDNWMSVEIYRLMHNGNLPSENDISINWIIDFLDKMKNMKYVAKIIKRKDCGSLYLTAKRMIYRFADEIIKQ